MTKGDFFLRRFPIPKGSIILGSFVYNTLEPRQGSFDPTTKISVGEKPMVDESEINNPFRNRASSKSLWMQAVLSRVMKGSLESGWGDMEQLSAEKATEYTLLDSDGWFGTLCSDEDVRVWIETRCVTQRKPIYMVTGYRTLSEATFGKQHVTNTKAAVEVEAPLSTSQGDLSGTLNVGGSAGGAVKADLDMKMQAPGEKIYEVQYRKVELRGFSSRSVDDAYLETANRWIKVFTFRDGAGSAEEEDAVEAFLSEDQFTIDGYQLIEEDGERSLIPLNEV